MTRAPQPNSNTVAQDTASASSTLSATDSKPRPLLVHHRRALEEGSGIDPAVIAERGYWSAERWQDLDGLRFSSAQKRPECFPALMIPQHDPTGEATYHTLRYDTPRVDKKGKVRKYEQPNKVGLRVDVPLRCLQRLRDASYTLWFTEGAKKADALASHDLVVVNTPGVDGWRSPSAIPDLFGIPFKEYVGKDIIPRSVVLGYDSDVMTNASVRRALVALANWMKQRRADVSVIDWKEADLPEGSKTGVDDFLTTHSIDELQLLLVPLEDWLESSRPKEGSPGCPYRATPAGIEWLKPDKQGLGNPTPMLLSNFAAKIVADVAEDDGAEVRRVFEIQSYLNERIKTFRVASDKYTSMNWVTEHMGAAAILYPGTGTKDHARAAIQLLSGDIPERVIFTHLGWRKIEDRWFYLHAGGAIGAEGAVDGIDVAITSTLAGYQLPDPPGGEELARCIRRELELLDVAPKGIAVPLLAAPYRAAIGDVDHSIHLTGATGAGKSVLAAFAQQHFGASMDGHHLPAGWSSTGNALELLAFLAKDALLTVDDFVPSGGAADVAKLNRDAERLFRGQGNQAGRQRMTVDATLRQGKPPRGLVLSTGEDTPRGQSLKARLLILEVGTGDLDWARVSQCQVEAADGTYAKVMAGFIRWLAPRYGHVHSALPQAIAALRAAAYKSNLHRRVPEIVANLAIGLSMFLAFAYQVGALSLAECEGYWASWWAALNEPAARQAKHQAAAEPARRFLTFLASAIGSGQAHLSGSDGGQPLNPNAWGWRHHPTAVVSGYAVGEWQPLGPRVGWIDEEDVYLDPEAAYSTAQLLGSRTGDPLLISTQTLRKRLKEQNFLASVDDARETLTVRRVYLGQTRRVLHLHLSSLYGSELPDIPAIGEKLAPPPWNPTGDPPKMSDSSSPMSGRMSGFTGRQDGGVRNGSYESQGPVRNDYDSLSTTVGNVRNVGSSLIDMVKNDESGISTTVVAVGAPDIGRQKPDIAPREKPDIEAQDTAIYEDDVPENEEIPF